MPNSHPADDQSLEETVFDVCIVGGGPGGLATLSAIHTPYSLDGSTMTESQKERALNSLKQQKQARRKVCVVDSGTGWLEDWKKNFETLSIEYLRSPSLAHPDLFDPNALLGFEVSQGREDELLESGCFDLKGLHALGQTQMGLWKLPSTRLFVDFCLHLSQELPHTFLGNSKVVGVDHQPGKTGPSSFQVKVKRGDQILTVKAKAVVLAMGTIGRPILPAFCPKMPSWRFWNQPPADAKTAGHYHSPATSLPTVVVGGGLTAVQVALKEVQTNPSRQVLLLSKRPLAEKHFDINVEWFDQRTTNKCMSDFYHHPMEDRKAALKEARRGGSVPPLYMKQIAQAETNGRLKCLVGTVTWEDEPSMASDQTTEAPYGPHAKLVHLHPPPSGSCPHGDGPHQRVSNNAIESLWVEQVIVACGVAPDSHVSPLIQGIQKKWPTRMEGGLPCVTQDLRWRPGLDLFVVGALGSLNIGPDAANLMGIRRASQLVANALGCRSWLRETVLKNPFEALWDSSSSDDDDEEEEISDPDNDNDDEDSLVYPQKSNLLEDDDAITATSSACSCCPTDPSPLEVPLEA